MKRLVSSVLAGSLLVLVVTVAVWDTGVRSSPGPLSSVHAVVDELRGVVGCAACHSDRERDLASACIACHEVVGRQLEEAQGVHGTIGGALARDCGNCHVEHVGDHVPLAGDHAFARVGVPDRDAYDHRHVATFDLNGMHDALACVACHENADAESLEHGSVRFLGLTQDCVACHDDAHRGALGANCTECHGQDLPFEFATEFAHDVRFPLEGAHAAVACKDCHGSEGTRASRAPRPAVRTCRECHPNPHDGPRADPDRVRLRETGDCSACHDTNAFSVVRVSAADHGHFSFALEGAHADLGCAACHGRLDASPRWGRSALANGRDCAACHESPHREGFVEAFSVQIGVEAGDACAYCHSESDPDFAVPVGRMRPEWHDASGFSLASPHGAAACADCHSTKDATPEFRKRFPGRSAESCVSCHEDAHGGQFPSSASCLECHDKQRFLPSKFGLEAHARTLFPLRGAHEAVACARCHRESPGNGARQFANTPNTCEQCHADPHEGEFDRHGRPRSRGGRTGCARCHDQSDFRVVSWSAEDHAVWTGYELTGSHAATDCRSCHGEPFRAAPQACASCHEDVHAGQFAEGKRSDCARCHVDTTSFRKHAFDHATHGRFRLDDTHRDLACRACHRPARTKLGRDVVRYKPLGVECKDCHDARGRKR